MKRYAFYAAILLAAGRLMADGTANDDVINAAKKLAGSDSYSWTTTTEASGNFKPGPVEGKTQKDGVVYIEYSFRDNKTEAVVKNGKGALKTEDGWVTLEDAAKDDGGGGWNVTRFLAMRLQHFKAPTDEAIDMVADTKSLTSADGVVSGDLTEDGVKKLAAFRRREGGTPPEVKDAKGSVKFWIKDGVLTKMEYKVSGTREFNGEDRPIDRTVTTTFKDVGTTTITVPDEAKSKLST